MRTPRQPSHPPLRHLLLLQLLLPLLRLMRLCRNRCMPIPALERNNGGTMPVESRAAHGLSVPVLVIGSTRQ